MTLKTEKILYYRAESSDVKNAAARIADGRHNMAVWGSFDVVSYFDRNGKICGREERPAHPDAVKISSSMTEKDAAAAHKKAAIRAGLRIQEEAAAAILAKGDSMTAADRLQLLALVNIAYHASGKIEGCHSVDSCAACDFCQRMINAAGTDELIICGACYAAADSWKEAAWRHHKLNALILSTVLFTVDELKTLDIPGELCRFNEDGDTVNETMGRNYLRIAAAHPGTCFGYWYKNAPAVGKALHAERIFSREQLPVNARFGHSSILIGIPARALWFDDFIFTVYPDHETTDAAITAGAHACNGRRCRACGYTCYKMARRAAGPLYIAEYLRTNEENRARILAAYNARMAARA